MIRWLLHTRVVGEAFLRGQKLWIAHERRDHRIENEQGKHARWENSERQG